jgi:hypothetical protein
VKEWSASDTIKLVVQKLLFLTGTKMKKICKKIYTAATIIMVLIIFCTILFWARFAVLEVMFAYIPQEVEISPSGLTPDLDASKDANMPSKIQFHTSLRNPAILGFTDIAVNAQFRDEIFLTPMILNHSKGSDTWQVIYYDKNLRLFVECQVDKIRDGLETSYKNTILSYIGTDGVCNKNDNDKKFGKLLFGNFFCSNLTFFDKTSRRFYRIAFDKTKFCWGPVIEESLGDIVQIGSIGKNEYTTGNLGFIPPMKTVKVTEDNKDEIKSIVPRTSHYKEDSGEKQKYADIPVTDEKIRFATGIVNATMAMNSNGKVFLVGNDLSVIKPIGQIADIYGSHPGPKDLFAYNFKVLKRNEEVKGAVLAGISPQGYTPYIMVFDENGNLINTKAPCINPPMKAESLPWSFVAKYLLESLQPWCLGIASYYTADKVDLAYMFRGMFIMPDSYIAFFGRETGDAGEIVQLLAASFVFLLPSLLIGIALGIRVYIKSGRAGLAKSERKAWLFTVLLFGIPGYIGYKLTNPRQMQITCKNCGKGRRPDMDSCHNCGASWNLDELDPPKWSVFAETA